MEKAIPNRHQKASQRTFYLVLGGESISLLGSSLTSFAVGVWVYQTTGSVTQFTLLMLFAVLPAALLSPVAGALVDRFDRRLVMLLADSLAGLSTLSVWLLFLSGRLEVWHLFITNSVTAIAGAFQMPAFTAATTLLVPKEQFGKASGLRQMGMALSQLLAPLLAGFLIVALHIQGVILIDLSTFALAVLVLFLVRFPRPVATAEGERSKGSLWQESLFGWRYIWQRKGLLGMLFLFAAVNFALAIVGALFVPMMLSLTTTQWLGVVMTVGGLGMLVGSLVMSAWGGPKRRIHGVLGFPILSGTAILIGGLRPSVPLIALAAFIFFLTIPLINGASEAIWQSKVEADIQGRVFAARNTIAISMAPLAYLIAGPLADRVFEPLMAEGGALAASLGRLIGAGEGRGIALLFIIMGLLAILVSVAGYLYPPLANVEDELPDVVTSTAAAATALAD